MGGCWVSGLEYAPAATAAATVEAPVEASTAAETPRRQAAAPAAASAAARAALCVRPTRLQPGSYQIRGVATHATIDRREMELLEILMRRRCVRASWLPSSRDSGVSEALWLERFGVKRFDIYRGNEVL